MLSLSSILIESPQKQRSNTIYINLKMILTLNKDCDAQAYNPQKSHFNVTLTEHEIT